MNDIDPALRVRLRQQHAEHDAMIASEQADKDTALPNPTFELARKREQIARLLPFAGSIALAAHNVVPINIAVVQREHVPRQKFRRKSNAQQMRMTPVVEGWKIARHKGRTSEYFAGDTWNPAGECSGTSCHTVILAKDGNIVSFLTRYVIGPGTRGPDLLDWKDTTPTNDYALSIQGTSFTLRDMRSLAQPTKEVIGSTKPGVYGVLAKPDDYPLPTPHLENLPLFSEPDVIEQGLIEFAVHNGIRF